MGGKKTGTFDGLVSIFEPLLCGQLGRAADYSTAKTNMKRFERVPPPQTTVSDFLPAVPAD
jgi:hypothetical protein